jgi:hypothetical protein
MFTRFPLLSFRFRPTSMIGLHTDFTFANLPVDTGELSWIAFPMSLSLWIDSSNCWTSIDLGRRGLSQLRGLAILRHIAREERLWTICGIRRRFAESPMSCGHTRSPGFEQSDPYQYGCIRKACNLLTRKTRTYRRAVRCSAAL